MALSVLELCCGAGGQALGFEAAGFRHEALIDHDPYACATVLENRANWNVIQADLFDIDTTCWHNVDVVAGGLPCPPFSVAGGQLGERDERNLFPALFRILEETKPAAVVIENVRGLMMPRFGAYRMMITKTLMGLGFRIHWALINAVEFDVPQKRTRSFMVGLRDHDTEFYWPLGTNFGGTVGEAIGDMMGSDGWHGVDEWIRKANRPAPTIVGGSRRHGGPDLGPTRARREWARLGVDGLGMANAPPPPDFEGRPRLTVEMAANLQSFPKKWQFVGSKTQRYRQVGNALPQNLAYAVARQVARCLA